MNVQIIDDFIDYSFRKEVWDYIQTQKWHVTWKRQLFDYQHYDYIPKDHTEWIKINVSRSTPSMYMPRACFASDDYTLEKDHPVLFKLWKEINQVLGNGFSIEGVPEGTIMEVLNDPAWEPPSPKDLNLSSGWRVYANSQPNEIVKRSHGIHRDSVDLESDKFYTLLYISNLEWYPSWFAENVFYPDDIENTGDHQQFQAEIKGNQSRNFSIGWADNGKIISPRPGRLILYDGRTLHTTRPSAIWAKEDRKAIVFRLKKK
jgi:hypothetical protein